jgi:tetratricopeptide (TPR) repeat protein
MGLFGKKKSGKDWFDDGNDFFDQENYFDAIKCFDKVILNKKIHGKNIAIALNSKGKCIAKLEEYETAIKCFDLAIQINPNSSVALIEKANALQNLGQNDEAEECLAKAKKLESKE